MIKRTRYVVALLAAFALVAPASAQTPAPVTHPTAPTLPTPTAPTVPARVGTPIAPTATGAPTPMALGKRIDVNAASETDLASLPGIGPVTAKAIVAGRPWDDLSALTSKKVMAKTVFERNKDRLALADINTSSADAMAKVLPGIGEKTAPKIVAGRPYAMPQDLVTKKVLTAAQLAKIQGVITY